MSIGLQRWNGQQSPACEIAAPSRSHGRLGPERAVVAVWQYDCRYNEAGALVPSAEHAIFCHARFVPETIIDGQGAECRTHGHLVVAPGPLGSPHDHVLRSIWPVAGRDMIKIKERLYRIVACHRIVDGGRHGHAYRVDIR